MPTFRTSEYSARERLSTSKASTRSITLRGEGKMSNYSQNESISFRIWNFNTRRVVKRRQVVFIELPLYLLPLSRRLFAATASESSNVSHLRQQPRCQLLFTQWYDTGCKKLHECFGLRSQPLTTYSHTRGFFAWGNQYTGIAVFSYICTCTCVRNGACTRVVTGGTASNRYGHRRLHHAAWCYPPGPRSQVRSPAPSHYGANRNSHSALAGFFQMGTVQQVHKLGPTKLGSHANLDIAYQIDDTFSKGKVYSTINSRRAIEMRKSSTPRRKLWAFDKQRLGRQDLT